MGGFNNQIMSAIQRRDKLYKKFEHFGLEADKYNFEVAEMHLHKMILKKRKNYIEQELAKNRSKLKDLYFKYTRSSFKQRGYKSTRSTGKRKHLQKVLL